MVVSTSSGAAAALGRLFPGFVEQRITLDDGTVMRAVTGGAGPVVLLVHGYPETLCAWHRLAPVLARDYTVVAADLPGYGESRLGPASRSLAAPSRLAFAADLLAMMDRLGHRRFALVGHDRGARAAFHMALYAQANLPRTLSVVQGLLQTSDRYTRVQLSTPAAMARAEREHRALADHLRKGEFHEACALLARHVETVRSDLVTLLDGRANA